MSIEIPELCPGILYLTPTGTRYTLTLEGGSTMFSALIEWFSVRAATKKMGLRDKGKVTAMVWDEDEEREVHGFLAHTYCGTHVRIGIVTSPEKRFVQWCHCCELIFSDDDRDDRDDDRGGKPSLPHDPDPGGEEFTPAVRQETFRVLERIAMKTVPK